VPTERSYASPAGDFTNSSSTRSLLARSTCLAAGIVEMKPWLSALLFCAAGSPAGFSPAGRADPVAASESRAAAGGRPPSPRRDADRRSTSRPLRRDGGSSLSRRNAPMATLRANTRTRASSLAICSSASRRWSRSCSAGIARSRHLFSVRFASSLSASTSARRRRASSRSASARRRLTFF
jgi:hypothetical protein